jgi:WD40 repeat protein
MVVAVLANRFAPSSRGLTRAERRPSNPPQRHTLGRLGADTRRHFVRNPRLHSNNEDDDDFNDDIGDYYNNLPHGDNENEAHGQSCNEAHPQTTAAIKDGIFVEGKQKQMWWWRVRRQRVGTGHRRKPFRAMACLTSLASDLDVIADWVFYHETAKNDAEYRLEYQSNQQQGKNVAGTLPYLIPPILLRLVLVSCILGTIMWIILATDGRIAAPILRRLGIDKLSIGFILFLCVCVEDIPQVVLTFLIEDYYEEEYLSTFAVCNVLASLYDTLIKIAEAIDERNDMVETGAWCKHSIEAAHTDTISCIVTLLPQHPKVPPNRPSVSSDDGRTMRHSFHPSTRDPSEWIQTNLLSASRPPSVDNQQHQPTTRSASSSSSPWPCLRFLSASLDGSIRLWDSRRSFYFNNSNSIHGTIATRDESLVGLPSLPALGIGGSPEVVAVQSYVNDTQSGVSCLALLGQPLGDDIRTSLQSYRSHSDSTYFVSGSDNGVAKLWHIDSGKCLRHYVCSEEPNPISSIAVVQPGLTFVTGMQSGMARLWDAWSGQCLALCRGHHGTIKSVCAMGDGVQFVTASADRTLRLWHWTGPHKSNDNNHHRHPTPHETTIPAPSLDDASSYSSARTGTSLSSDALFNPIPMNEPTRIPMVELKTCFEIYQGHLDVVLCVACMECGTMFASGSMDQTARLWSAESGECLQIFTGHTAGVSAVAAIDEVTLLTGSYDTSVKVWDALRGICLRTYTGHSAVVTGISVTDDDTTFVTSSADRSIKLWVLTALATDQAHTGTKVFDQVLDINDGMCRGRDPD